MGWLDGALRIMPSWEFAGWGHTVPLEVFLPAVIFPGLIFNICFAWPALERRWTGDNELHNLLDLSLIHISTNGHEDEVHSFGHIVVDEVQDLSPLQLRMLARRSLSGSMTVVGDIAQATGPWSPSTWDDVTRHLSPQRATRLVELTVSYRTPSEVLEVAAQVLAIAAPEITPPRPVRQSGFTPRIIAASRGGLAHAVAQATREEVAAVAPGRVAVLGPAVMLPELARALSDAGLDATDPRDPAGEGPPVATTRGLRTLYAVSYTHLDVYKRQVMACAGIFSSCVIGRITRRSRRSSTGSWATCGRTVSTCGWPSRTIRPITPCTWPRAFPASTSTLAITSELLRVRDDPRVHDATSPLPARREPAARWAGRRGGHTR